MLNNNDVDLDEELDVIESLDKDIIQEKKLNESRQNDFFSSVSGFSNAVALMFSQLLVIGQQTNVKFVEEIGKFTILIILFYFLRNLIISKEASIKKPTGPFIYEIIVDFLNFTILLFVYILSKLILSYIDLNLNDTVFIAIISLFYILMSKIYTFSTTSKKIQI